MIFDITSLDCFLAVAELGSFTRAGERVSRTQSAVSQQILKIESLIGRPVFHRGKHLTLTSEGEILLTYAKKIIQLNRDASDRFKRPELTGELSFGLPEDFASVFLSDVLAEFSALHPRVLLNVVCDLTLNLFDRFKNQEFDLVLLKMNKISDFPVGKDVWSEGLEWVGHHQLMQMDPSLPVPLILSPQPCIYRTRAIQSLEKVNRRWRVVFSSHSYAGKIAAVEAGMGITVLPRNMIPKTLHIMSKVENLPHLEDVHISLLKHNDKNLCVNSLEGTIVQRLSTSFLQK